MERAAGSRSETKHAAILSAARAAFLRDGFLGANMDVVAAQSGVSKQTVYAHFGSKENLYLQTVAEMTQQIAAQLPAPPRVDLDREGLQAWLFEYGQRQLQAVLTPEIVRLRRLVTAEAERFPGSARAFHANGPQRSLDLLTEAFAQVAGKGVLRIDDPSRAASDFNWLLMGELVNRAMMLGSVPTADQARHHAEHAVAVFLAAHSADTRSVSQPTLNSMR